jgi:hypothetical protein
MALDVAWDPNNLTMTLRTWIHFMILQKMIMKSITLINMRSIVIVPLPLTAPEEFYDASEFLDFDETCSE